MKTLDQKDRQLLALLAEDARLPLTTLAQRIHLSRSATRERLQRLEDTGIILGYTVRVRWTNGDEAGAWLLITLQPGVACTVVAPRILAVPGVTLCHALGGTVALLVQVHAATAEEISGPRVVLPGLAGLNPRPPHT